MKMKSKKKQQMGLKIRAATYLAKAGSADCHDSVASKLFNVATKDENNPWKRTA